MPAREGGELPLTGETASLSQNGAQERDDHLCLGSNCSYLCLSSHLGRDSPSARGPGCPKIVLWPPGAQEQSLLLVQESPPPPRFLVRVGPVLGQHCCIIYTLLITGQIGAFLSMHFEQLGRQHYSTSSTEGYLPSVPASASEPCVSVSARKGRPRQHTAVRRAEAHRLTQLINGKP